MRTKFKFLTAVVAAAGIVGGIGWYQSALADGSSGTPGSSSDPIVTKSYVDQKIAEATKPGGVSGGTSSSSLAVVTVPFGQKIIVQDGGELIVRTGKAIAYSEDANGLSDMTDGVDIAPGKPVGNNHLILFPRGGRGIQADPNSKSDLIVLVRGGYELR
ncbi:hypothetical protein COLU111180_03435 [Cohnella lubricantis]|uniref:Uncharacterized protein n=1 Tax=Cohnella lubricantis TaxID=2163172 RepID=A0A841THQ6_9BACL|nr:hypothetical protein [Cohnella lubricantis]MBB6678770.1 hypothetical protein [Cohnella lubricantis]MBP2117854.1 hypothetical protein [Cohnella lubricantis]